MSCSIELVPATRFGAKPAHPNTFVNHHAGPNTPGFISEQTRFGGASQRDYMFNKVDFQVEDKQKKQKLQQSKLAEKQRNVEKLQNQIEMYD